MNPELHEPDSDDEAPVELDVRATVETVDLDDDTEAEDGAEHEGLAPREEAPETFIEAFPALDETHPATVAAGYLMMSSTEMPTINEGPAEDPIAL